MSEDRRERRKATKGMSKQDKIRMDKKTAACIRLVDIYFRLPFWRVRKRLAVKRVIKKLLYGEKK